MKSLKSSYLSSGVSSFFPSIPKVFEILKVFFETVLNKVNINYSKDKESYLCIAPSYRCHDIQRDVDIYEEIARVWGYNKIKNSYELQSDPRYAAARMWIDEIIDPRETRNVLIRTLEIISHQTKIPEPKYGVIQV